MAGESSPEQQEEGQVGQETAAAEEAKQADPAPDAQEGGDQAQTDAQAAESSTAGKDEGPKSTLDVIEAALKPKDEGQEQSSGSEDGEDGSKTDAEAKEAKEGEKPAEADKAKAEEDDKPPPFHKHPRWREMVAERDDLKTKVATLEQREKELYQPAVERWQQIQTFMEEADLTSEEVNTGFQIMRAMRKDPAEAYRVMLPYMQSLEAVVNGTIPQDLQEKVDAGLVDEDTARHLGRLQAGTQRQQAESERAARIAEERQQQTQRETAEKLKTAGDTWWNERASSDPDWTVKQARVADRIKSRLFDERQAGRAPTSPEDVRKLCDQALEEVNAEIAKMAPKPRPTNPASGGGQQVATTPQPKSVLDIVEMNSSGAR